jgi:plastocyanin domain-containing protein
MKEKNVQPELSIASIAFQNEEKENRCKQLSIANKELTFKTEKRKEQMRFT